MIHELAPPAKSKLCSGEPLSKVLADPQARQSRQKRMRKGSRERAHLLEDDEEEMLGAGAGDRRRGASQR